MSRSFLTGLNLNKNELLNARIQNLATPPSNPVLGQIYFDTDTNQINVWDGTAWAALAAGGNVGDQIQAAIDLITTDDIEEGSTNLYFTDQRAVDAVGGTDTNTADTLVKRDNNGDFAAGTVTVTRLNIGTVGFIENDDDIVISNIDGYDVVLNGEDIRLNAEDDVRLTAGTSGHVVLSATTGVIRLEGPAIYAGANLTDPYADADRVATQGYVDDAISEIDLSFNTDEVTEGTTNLYFTAQRAADAVADEISDAVSTAIDALDTDAIEEGSTNLYFTNQRALDATSAAYDTAGTAQGIVDALDTDDIEEGATNRYFTEERIDDHISGTYPIEYDAGDISLALGTGGGLVTDEGGLYIQRSVVDGWYDAAGAAAAAQTAAESYADDLASNYDVAGAAAQAYSDGVDYTNGEITSALSTAQGYATTALEDAQSYADGLVQGLNVKDSVRIATNLENINITTTLVAGGVYDETTLQAGDRVLVKDQTDATENGIYVVQASGAPLRAADADPVADELGRGSYVLVTSSTYAATGWVVTAYSAGATTWTQFSAANEYTAGDSIGLIGNVISVLVDNQTIARTGEGNLYVLLTENGGIAKEEGAPGIFINTGTGLTVNGSNELTFASGYGVQKYAVNNPSLTATSGVVTWTVTHNIGSKDVTVQVRDNVTDALVEVDVVLTSTTVATLSWVSAGESADAYRVVVVG